MTKKIVKDLMVVLSIVGASVLAAYFGYQAYAERQVYYSVIEYVLEESRSSIRMGEMRVFLSRPIKCELDSNVQYSNHQTFQNFLTANEESTAAIHLAGLEGIVPIVSREDATKIRSADYQWYPNQGIVWVSRVGLSEFNSQAAICLVMPGERHIYAYMFFLERGSGNWEISSEHVAHVKI